MGKTVFDQALRVLACEACGAPVQGTIAGGRVRCDYCNAINILPARDDQRDKATHQHAKISEGERYQRLREQDNKPLMPPASLQGLMSQGQLAANAVPEATKQWTLACDEVTKGASFGASERLFFLAILLYGYLSEQGDELKVRALIETSLQHLDDPTFRAVLHGMLCRNAARLGDHDAAAYWLSLCDPQSDNLQVDSSYRLSAAYLATAKRNFDEVVRLLGSRIDDVPIADNNDFVCGVLRANALEHTGQLDLAVEQLMHWSSKSGTAVQKIVAANASLQLCGKSLKRAITQAAEFEASIIETKSGIKVGNIVLPIILTSTVIPIVAGVGFTAFDPDMMAWLLPVLIVGMTGLIFVSVFRSIGAAARTRAQLEKIGVAATGTILAIEGTGTRINNQPQMKLRMRIETPGQPPFLVEHREVIPTHQLAQLPLGTQLNVRYNPNDRAMLAIIRN